MKKQNNPVYQKIKTLSKSAKSAVYLAQPNGENKKYILKQFNISNLSEKEINNIENEYNILSTFNSRYITKFYDSFQVQSTYNIVLEYVEGSLTLNDLLINHQKKGAKFIKEELIWSIFIQIALALAQIHGKRVIHRNIKPSSIYITNDNKIKVSNFKSSIAFSKINRYVRGFAGTPFYAAPEMWLNRLYDSKIDVWSLGVLIYELCTYKRPYMADSNLGEVIIKTKYKEISNVYTKEIKQMVDFMLNKNEMRRPTINEVIQHYIFIGKSKVVNLYDFVIKICPWIDKKGQMESTTKSTKGKGKAKGTNQPKKKKGVEKEETEEEKKIKEIKQLEFLLNNTRTKCTMYFNQLINRAKKKETNNEEHNKNESHTKGDVTSILDKYQESGIQTQNKEENNKQIKKIVPTNKKGEVTSLLDQYQMSGIPSANDNDVISDIKDSSNHQEEGVTNILSKYQMSEFPDTSSMEQIKQTSNMNNDILLPTDQNKLPELDDLIIQSQNEKGNETHYGECKKFFDPSAYEEGKEVGTVTKLLGNYKMDDSDSEPENEVPQTIDDNKEEENKLQFVVNEKISSDTHQSFIPFVVDNNTSKQSFNIIENDFDNSIAQENKKWIDDLNDKIICVTENIIKEIGKDLFIKIYEQLNNITNFNEFNLSLEIQTDFENLKFYQNEISNLEANLESIIKNKQNK